MEGWLPGTILTIPAVESSQLMPVFLLLAALEKTTSSSSTVGVYAKIVTAKLGRNQKC